MTTGARNQHWKAVFTNNRRIGVLLLASILTLSQLFAASPTSDSRIVESLHRLPLAFEKNQGQASPSVDFMARGAGYSVFLSQGNARLTLHQAKPTAHAVVDLRLLGANQHSIAAARDVLAGTVNYFLGNDSARWRVDIPTCGRVVYPSVYRGIDLAYYGNQGRLEYDFIVAPGARPDAIRFAVHGARHIHVTESGDLVLETGSGPVAFRKPVTYQEIAGARHRVESRYALTSANQVRFVVGGYDPRHSLVIDLRWSIPLTSATRIFIRPEPLSPSILKATPT